MLNIEGQLERRRQQMIQEFTAMETALSSLQSQGSWLSAQLSSLQSLY